MYTAAKKFMVSKMLWKLLLFFYFKGINMFIQQGHVKLIKIFK